MNCKPILLPVCNRKVCALRYSINLMSHQRALLVLSKTNIIPFSSLCGANCCPSNAGLVCDNVTIPGSPFCNVPANICPPGSKKVKRAGSTTDACLATTDTAAFASEISPTTSATTGLMTVSMSMTSAGASSGPAGSTHGTASTASGGSSTSPSGSASAAQFTGGAQKQYHVNGDIIWVMIGLAVTLILGIGSLVLIV